MSKDKSEAETRPRKGKGLIGKLMIGFGLLAAGGGGAFGAMSAGLIGGSEHGKPDNSPKLVRKGEEDPYAPRSESKEDAGMEEVHGDGGSEYRSVYYSFADDFTSNLKNSDALLQVSLACSTRRDGRILMWLRKHELAVRSALLAVLADTPETDITTLEGKQRLQRRLAEAINKVLAEREGFGGVDAVYFKSFIIQ